MALILIIPCKPTSEKNFSLVGGFSCLSHTISTARSIPASHKVVYSDPTDYRVINSIGDSPNFTLLPHPPVSSHPGFDLAIHTISHLSLRPEDNILFLVPSTPFRSDWRMQEIIKHYKAKSPGTLVTLSRTIQSPFRSLQFQGDHLYQTVPSKDRDRIILDRQKYPDTYIYNGYASISNVGNILETQSWISGRLIGYMIDHRVWDFETMADIQMYRNSVKGDIV